MADLAIVIPAYKSTFFHAALQSLEQQTNKNFTVYIGDDFSPFNLKEIVDQFAEKIHIIYRRFPSNLGSKNLVGQWARCVDLTEDEKWLWLFSDDDIAERNCVERFYNILGKKRDRFDVYRFNTCLIDNNGKIIREPLIGPEEESTEAMAYNLLLGKRGNSMPDHIFSRYVYESNGGFVFTNYAQSADWATSILFSAGKGMCIIQDAKIFWRKSSENVSSVSKNNRRGMIKGYLSFLVWLQKYFEYLDDNKNTPVTREMIRYASHMNFRNLMQHHYKGFGVKEFPLLMRFMQKNFHVTVYKAFTELVHIELLVYKLKIRVYLSSVKKSLYPKNKTSISI
jgi:glycosyltransferase involved in cell wall biosynthesis